MTDQPEKQTGREILIEGLDSEKTSEVRGTFHYVKSPQYRSIYVDGAWGGVSPRGVLAVTLYSERFPIPKSMTFAVNDEGLGEELEREAKDGIIREVEATAFMDLRTAIALHTWLTEKIPVLAKRSGMEVEMGNVQEDEDQ